MPLPVTALFDIFDWSPDSGVSIEGAPGLINVPESVTSRLGSFILDDPNPPESVFVLSPDSVASRITIGVPVPATHTLEFAIEFESLPADFGSPNLAHVFVGALNVQGGAAGILFSQLGIAVVGGPNSGAPKALSGSSGLVSAGEVVVRIAVNGESGTAHLYVTLASQLDTTGHILRHTVATPKSDALFGDAAVIEVLGNAANYGAIGIKSYRLSSSLLVPNKPPVAVVGDDKAVAKGGTVVLDGTGSYDPEGTDLTFNWQTLSQPVGSNIVLSGESKASALNADILFTSLLAGASGNGQQIVITLPPINPLSELTITLEQDVFQINLRHTDAGLTGITSVDELVTALTDPLDPSYNGSISVLITAEAVGLGGPNFVTAGTFTTAGGVDSATAKATFYPDVTGMYEFQLIVTDSDAITPLSSAPITTLVNVLESAVAIGNVPDPAFVWSYLPDFWNWVEDKDRFKTFWSALIQVVGADMLRAWQVDYGKSLRDIPRTFTHKWVGYPTTLECLAEYRRIQGHNAPVATCTPMEDYDGDLSTQFLLLGEAALEHVSVGEPVLLHKASGSVPALVESLAPFRVISVAGPVASNDTQFTVAGGMLAAGIKPGDPVIFTTGTEHKKHRVVNVVNDTTVTFRPPAEFTDGGPTVQIGGVLIVDSDKVDLYEIIDSGLSNGRVYDDDGDGTSTVFRLGHEVFDSDIQAGDLLRLDNEDTSDPSTLSVIDAASTVTYAVTGGPGFQAGEDLKENNAGGAVIGVIVEVSAIRIVVNVTGPGAAPVATDTIYGDTSATTATADVVATRSTGFSGQLLVDTELNLTANQNVDWQVLRYVGADTLDVEAPAFVECTDGSGFEGAIFVSDQVTVRHSIPTAVLGPANEIVSFSSTEYEEDYSITGVIGPFVTLFGVPGDSAGELTGTATIEKVRRLTKIPVDPDIVGIPRLQFSSAVETEYLSEAVDYEVGNGFITFTPPSGTDGTYTGSPDTFSSASAIFTQAQVGQLLNIPQSAGVSGGSHTILTVSADGTTVTTSSPTFSGATVTDLAFSVIDPNVPDSWWAEYTYVDNAETIENNFGLLVGMTRDDVADLQTDYLSSVRALSFALWSGPTVSNIQIGAQVFFNLPFSEVEGTVVEVEDSYSLTQGRITIQDKENAAVYRTYFYLKAVGLANSPVTGLPYTNNDAVALFAPLSKGAVVEDYVNSPKWYVGILEGAQELRKFHTFRVGIDMSAVDDTKGFDLVVKYVDRIKPAYTDLLLVGVQELADEISVTDAVTIDGLLSLEDEPFVHADYLESLSPAGVAQTSGAAQANSVATEVKLDATATSVNSSTPGFVKMVDGVLAGQVREITSYVGATKVATLTNRWNPVITHAGGVLFSGDEVRHDDATGAIVGRVKKVISSTVFEMVFSGPGAMPVGTDVLHAGTSGVSVTVTAVDEYPTAGDLYILLVGTPFPAGSGHRLDFYDGRGNWVRDNAVLVPHPTRPDFFLGSAGELQFPNGGEPPTAIVDYDTASNVPVAGQTLYLNGSLDFIGKVRAIFPDLPFPSTTGTLLVDIDGGSVPEPGDIIQVAAGAAGFQCTVNTADYGDWPEFAHADLRRSELWIPLDPDTILCRPTETGTLVASAAGPPQTITLGAGASAVDDTYVNYMVKITEAGDPLLDEFRRIMHYVGATKVATLAQDFSGAPDGDEDYSLHPPKPRAVLDGVDFFEVGEEVYGEDSGCFGEVIRFGPAYLVIRPNFDTYDSFNRDELITGASGAEAVSLDAPMYVTPHVLSDLDANGPGGLQNAEDYSTIVRSDVADPTVILTSSEHGLSTGDGVLIWGHTGAIPDVAGAYTVIVLTPTTFTVPVAVTTGGAGGVVMRTLPRAGAAGGGKEVGPESHMDYRACFAIDVDGIPGTMDHGLIFDDLELFQKPYHPFRTIDEQFVPSHGPGLFWWFDMKLVYNHRDYETVGPGSSLALVSIAIGSPSVVTTASEHQLRTNDIVEISGSAGTVPSVEGFHQVTVTSATTFTIPVNVTGGATTPGALARDPRWYPVPEVAWDKVQADPEWNENILNNRVICRAVSTNGPLPGRASSPVPDAEIIAVTP